MSKPAPARRRVFALVPCAGSGSRAGAPIAKQYVEVGGRPIVVHTLAALGGVRRFSKILVVVAPEDEHGGAECIIRGHCGPEDAGVDRKVLRREHGQADEGAQLDLRVGTQGDQRGVERESAQCEVARAFEQDHAGTERREVIAACLKNHATGAAFYRQARLVRAQLEVR